MCKSSWRSRKQILDLCAPVSNNGVDTTTIPAATTVRFPVTSFELNRDLYLEIGRAWIDFGLTLPGAPQMVVGYDISSRRAPNPLLNGEAWA